ncbi:MAG TPA: serine/threonine-protein kinase [Woeseiaceae bacterium]|nr:serine/threonine-protein kinase [Woeseiaceae bacterium]
MERGRWLQIREIYREALDRPEPERSEFVREACAGDEALAAEIIALLETSGGATEALGDIVGDVAGSASSGWWGGSVAGERIGPYRLLDVIGEGGMGQVYLAERADDEFEQRVAIKMANWLRASPQVIERFRVERQILANLEHPNIARLLDGGRTGAGVPYIVMEYVDGVSIVDYAATRSLDRRLDLFLAICDAVQYAHRKLVVHRDIKPSNILVGGDGVPKLLDFGIAKLLDPADTEPLTRAEARIMTPEYASPEQLSGQPVTTATDVYGLGMILYRLMADALPFDLGSRTSPEIRDIVCHTEPVLPSRAAAAAGKPERASRLRGDLDNVIMMALRKDPQRRYATVKELADDIRNYRADQPVRARGDGWTYRTGKFLRRHRAAAAAVVIVVGGIAAQTVFYTQQLAEERDTAVRERQVAENTTEFLVDLFEVSDPATARGETVTAREILDRGAERIREELTDEDDVRARMLQTMGRVYERLGLYDDARELMEEAVLLNREVLEPQDRRLIDSLNELSWLHYRREDWSAARQLAEEALALQRSAAGGDIPEMARSLNLLGTITYYLDDYEGSIGYYRRALAVLDAPEWRDSDLRGTTLNHLGIVYSTLSRFDEAEGVYRESLEIRRRVLGEDHPDTATAYVNLGALYANMNRYEDALEYANRGLEIDRRTKGDDHVDVAFDLNLLGSIELQRGNLEQALNHALEAAAIWRTTAAGPTHSRYARALDQLADVYRRLGRLDEAQQSAQQALAIFRDEYGTDHTLTSNAHYTLGLIHTDRGDPAAAREHLQRALDIRVQAFGESHREVWNAMHRLAKLDLDAGDAATALARAEQAIALIEGAGLTELDIYEWLGGLREASLAAL